MADLPVVAVIATHGEERLGLLLNRSLPSVSRQTRSVDLVCIVSDNDPLCEFLELEDVEKSFAVSYKNKVRLLQNERTRGNSGTGSWNTGILEALSTFGENCWVAILDDDDEWKDNHIEKCIGAIKEKADCQWIVSGIIRQGKSGRTEEPLLRYQPAAEDFFATNPGVQGSNMFVRCSTVLRAGLFDEKLSSSTDRDICVRLCDVLQETKGGFESTGDYTVVHYADDNRSRVSSRGSPAKIQGMKMFYVKHASRMSPAQQCSFKERAIKIFGCREADFHPSGSVKKLQHLEAWSPKKHLPLNVGTFDLLPKLEKNQDIAKKRNALFGIITSDVRRLVGLLDDLHAASESNNCDFIPFVIIFANANDELSALAKKELNERGLLGFILALSNPAVKSILEQCHGFEESDWNTTRLPISLSRSILQVFIFSVIESLDSVDCVIIIDDDKRLPKHWSPFVELNGCESSADILIGRDLRTPPNPSLFSLRTNLIDLLYNLDLYHSNERNNTNVKALCLSQQPIQKSDMFDWYYDLSSSKFDHLEMPVYSDLFKVDCSNEEFVEHLLRNLLLGTPLCRDAIPLESGKTEQRGGCMIILNKNVNSFHPLALQQHAPKLSFDDGSVSYTRRSDSFWCREQKKLGFDVEVCKQLFVYHDNRFDEVPTSSGIRKNIVQEICGGILCRGVVWRKKYKERRLLELRSWLYRVNGILQTLQNRSYCSKSMIRFLIIPLKEILDFDSWEAEVFSVIERNFGRLKDFVPNPADFKSLHIAPAIAQDDMRVIKEEWNTARVDHARGVLVTLVGMEDGVFVGLGSEGVCFRVKDLVYKVFDQVESLNDLPSTEAIKLLNASYVKCDNFPFILKRPYYSGTLFRGNSGPAMIKLLREWKGNYLYHTNLTPDNLILDDQEEMLTIVDIGKDVHISTSSECYAHHFDDMCKRAFLCVQFGSYADNAHKLKKLKTWMRGDSTSPHLVGFENFKKLVNNPKEGDSQFKLMKYLEQKDAVCCAVVTATPRFFDRSTQVFLAYDDDTKTIDDINRAISGMILEGGHNRLAVVIDDPHSLEQGAIRPLWFYRRHIRRLQMHTRFTLEEDDVLVVDGNRFQEIAAFHVFLLTCSPMTTTPPLRHGCFLMIKSCPMEYHTILSDVRRIVHCLEPATSFKSIVLVSDISKEDGFLRQYTSIDMKAYIAALHKIKHERLVDQLLLFDGQDTSHVIRLNKLWLGKNNCTATHSFTGQQCVSTFAGFEAIKGNVHYKSNDLVLQMDSDVILHCDNCTDGVVECIAEFEGEPSLVSFAFPIPTRMCRERHYVTDDMGTPFRFEIRCSFVHLDRVLSVLPLKIPDNEVPNCDAFCITKGWWHTFDFNIQLNNMKSCRGTLGKRNNWFFIHPPNDFKTTGSQRSKLLLVSDVISSKYISKVDLETKPEWEAQLDLVNLNSHSLNWLQERNETVVVAFNLDKTPCGAAMQAFRSFLMQTKNKRVFDGCGVILFNNGSHNYEDIFPRIFEEGRKIFKSRHLTTFTSRHRLSTSSLRTALKSICRNPSAITFITCSNTEFDLRKSVCLLPKEPLQFCSECGSFHDQKTCPCFQGKSDKLMGVSATSLPVSIGAFGSNSSCVMDTTFYTSDYINEGNLKVQITALVKGSDHIKGAENVCVRIHSECLTGDVFYSQKCDCGEQKTKFLHIMQEEEVGVFVYIKGHEGRGAGLLNKIKAYEIVDNESSKNHVDALLEVGCQSDIRGYDAAVNFLKETLQVKSLRLFSNNPKKHEAVKKVFGSNCLSQPMPSVPGKHNEKYLKEKVLLCGHDGLLD